MANPNSPSGEGDMGDGNGLDPAVRRVGKVERSVGQLHERVGALEEDVGGLRDQVTAVSSKLDTIAEGQRRANETGSLAYDLLRQEMADRRRREEAEQAQQSAREQSAASTQRTLLIALVGVAVLVVVVLAGVVGVSVGVNVPGLGGVSGGGADLPDVVQPEGDGAGA